MPRRVGQITISLSRGALACLDLIIPPAARGRSGQLEELIIASASSLAGSAAVARLRSQSATSHTFLSPRSVEQLKDGVRTGFGPRREYWIGSQRFEDGRPIAADPDAAEQLLPPAGA